MSARFQPNNKRTALPLLALVPALMLAACNSTPTTADNAASLETVDNLDLSNAALPEDADSSAATQAAPVAVEAVPAVAADTPAAEAAPLTDAAEVESDIASGAGISRVAHGDGWAWMRGDQIIRTASSDGKEVAYYRGGDTNPYLVQRDDRTYAYSGTRMTHSYDRGGHVQAPDTAHAREAAQLADRARHDHDSARQAADHRQPSPPAGRGSASGGHDTPHPTPTPTHRADGSSNGHAGDRESAHHPGPTPTPSPTPTHGRPDHRATDHSGSSNDRGNDQRHDH